MNMNTKKKYVWKLYSGASWYLRDVTDVLPFVCASVAIGCFLGWLVNVG